MGVLTTSEEISELAFGFMASKALFAALHHGLFTQLAGGPLSPEEAAEACGIRPDGARTLIDCETGARGALQLDANGVSRDPAEVELYVNDPLVHHGKMSSRLIAELMLAMRVTLAAASEIEVPLLIMHGEADVLTSPSGSREFYTHAASADKTLKLYPGLYHEIFNEPEKDKVLTDMTDWLEARL